MQSIMRRKVQIPVPALILLGVVFVVLLVLAAGGGGEGLFGTASSAVTPLDLNDLVSRFNTTRTSPLTLNAALTGAAQNAANDTAAGAAKDFGTYITGSGYKAQTYYTYSYNYSRGKTSSALATSLAGATAIFSVDYTEIGVGVAANSSGRHYYVVFLAKPVTTTAPGADISKPANPNPVDQANAIIDLLNSARTKAGLCPIVTNNLLVAAATRHSNDMNSHDFLEHTGSDGSSPQSRIAATGYAAVISGENVLSRTDVNASGAFDQWWNSPPHKDNMMNPNFIEIGIYYAGPSATGKYYYTMVLGSRSGDRATCNEPFIDPNAVPGTTSGGATGGTTGGGGETSGGTEGSDTNEGS